MHTEDQSTIPSVRILAQMTTECKRKIKKSQQKKIKICKNMKKKRKNFNKHVDQ